VAVADERLHRAPRLGQGDAVVVDHLTILVSRILVVARPECERRVDQIAVGIVDLKPAKTRFESRPDALRAMIGIPQLRGNEHVLALNRSGREHLTQRITHRFLIAVPLCAIEMSKPDFQCSLGRLLCCGEIRNERAEPDSGHRTLSMGQLNL